MLRFIFYLLFFYFLYRIIKFFSRSFGSSAANRQPGQSRTGNSKYTDVEEAKYIEIESERKKQSEENSPEEK